MTKCHLFAAALRSGFSCIADSLLQLAPLSQRVGTLMVKAAVNFDALAPYKLLLGSVQIQPAIPAPQCDVCTVACWKGVFGAGAAVCEALQPVTRRPEIERFTCCLLVESRKFMQELAQKYQVRAMPTFLAFHKGEKVGECVGADLGKIGQLIEKCASSLTPFIECPKALCRPFDLVSLVSCMVVRIFAACDVDYWGGASLVFSGL